mgnify:FL=1
MGFNSRLFFYFFGIILGVFILWFSLKFRQQPITFNYLPNARVVNHILKKNIGLSDYVKCKMMCYSVDSLLLRKHILQSKVDFKKSQIRNTMCKTYHLRNNSAHFVITNCNDTFNLIDFVLEDAICEKCN